MSKKKPLPKYLEGTIDCKQGLCEAFLLKLLSENIYVFSARDPLIILNISMPMSFAISKAEDDNLLVRKRRKVETEQRAP